MPKRDAARACVCPPLLARKGGLCGRGIHTLPGTSGGRAHRTTKPFPQGRSARPPSSADSSSGVGCIGSRIGSVERRACKDKDPPTAAVTLGPGSKVAFHTMEEDRAAATIAAAKRGKNARKQAAERKEQSKASSTIAAARKGKNARKERQEMSDGAVRIQSQYRGRQSRARCAETGADQAQRYYTPAEVAKHDRADDLRVSLFGKVLDLSELVRANRGLLVQPLIAAAGTDITHWFDDSTHDPCTYIDPETEIEVPFTPMGRFLHCVPVSCAPPSRGSSRLSCL